MDYGIKLSYEKLDDLRDVEIIEEVPQTTPTTWVSPLVVFPKADG